MVIKLNRYPILRVSSSPNALLVVYWFEYYDTLLFPFKVLLKASCQEVEQYGDLMTPLYNADVN